MAKRLALFFMFAFIWTALDALSSKVTDIQVVIIMAFFLTWAAISSEAEKKANPN